MTDERTTARDGPKLKVGFLLLDKFTLNAFSGFIDALRLAADIGGRSRQLHCAWTIMGQGPVQASCGLCVTPSEPLLDPARFDYLAVCGGNTFMETWQPPSLTAYLQGAEAAGVKMIGVCTGTFAIARAGLMDGYPACVHWNVHDAFREQFPDIEAVPDRIFIDAGKRVTCAGSAGAADLALHLIARHCGAEKAQRAIRHMMLQEVRPSTYPQAHFYSDLSGVKDARVRRAVHLMEQTLNEPLGIAALAAQVHTSARQLERGFKAALGVGPGHFYRNMRLRYGAFLLRHTDMSVAEIAADCGFCDASHFARDFRRLFAVTPHGYRTMPEGELSPARDLLRYRDPQPSRPPPGYV